MRNMRKEIELMQRIFEKYRLQNPLPGGVQEHAYRMKRKMLITLLKRLGLYSPIYGAIVFFYLLLKKIGFGFSVAQSAAALVVASAVTAAGITAGGYAVVKKYTGNTPISPPREEQEAPKKKAELNKPAPSVKSDATDAAKYRYQIQFYGLENNGADEAMVRRLTASITGEILRIKGKGTTALVSVPSGSNWLLTGSVEKLDRSYLLTVRLTDKRTRRIVFAASEESAGEEGLIKAGAGFARSISEKIQ